MERKQKSFGLADIERMNRSRPHTPPYTPDRSKPRFERADSPASSIHPTETVSPAKESEKRADAPDTIMIQELDESHAEYATTIELVYPYETEEYNSERFTSEESDLDADDSDGNITSRLSQLHCEDPAGEARMHKGRRKRRLSKRLASRKFKRTHSESVKSESDVTDVDAMADHDSPATARRLRRRTRGPHDMVTELTSEDGLRSSPQPKASPSLRRHGRSELRGDQYRGERRAVGCASSHSASSDPMDISE